MINWWSIVDQQIWKIWLFVFFFLLQIHKSDDLQLVDGWLTTTDIKDMTVCLFNCLFVCLFWWLTDHQQLVNWEKTLVQLMINCWEANIKYMFVWLFVCFIVCLIVLMINWWSTVDQLRSNISSADDQLLNICLFVCFFPIHRNYDFMNNGWPTND